MKTGEESVVLITGANRGIGLEIGLQLGCRGFHVIVASRDLRAAENAVATIGKANGKASAVRMDVSDGASIRAGAAEFRALKDHLDVLINNAGIYADEGVSILNVSRERLAGTLQTNTWGPVEVTQTFLSLLRKSKAARVINISSGYGQLDGLSAQVPSYCLSKLALNGVTIMLAEALKPDNIAVNSMCPGWVRTDMGGPNASRSVEEGADTAVWLASEAPQSATGKFFRDRREIAW